MSNSRWQWLFPIIPLLLGGLAGFACFKAAGATIGLFFSGVFFAAIITPPMALAVSSPIVRALNVVALIVGIGGVWLFTHTEDQATLPQVLNCLLVLTCVAICLGALAVFLSALRFNPFVAVAITFLLAMAWLMWPIWLSPILAGPNEDALVGWLVPAHPLLTINGLLDSGDAPDNWNERSIAYHLTNLGNDVSFEKPSSARMACWVHGGISILLLAMTGVIRMIRLYIKRRPSTPHASENERR